MRTAVCCYVRSGFGSYRGTDADRVVETTQLVVVTATDAPTSTQLPPTAIPAGMSCDPEKAYYYMALEQPLYVGPGTSYLQTDMVLERGSVVVLATQRVGDTVWGMVTEIVYPINMDMPHDLWVSVSTGNVVFAPCENGGLSIQTDSSCGRTRSVASLFHPATGLEVGTLAADEQVYIASTRDENCMLVDAPARDGLSDFGPLLCVRPELIAICDVTVLATPAP